MARMNIERKEKKERLHRFVRTLLYIFLMVFSYIFMLTVRTGTALPILLIPCAMCYAMREQPLSSAVYALFCGLMLDSAFNMLPGLNAVILMWSALLASLLVNNLIRRSIINFIWMDLTAIAIQGSLHYTLDFFLWGDDPKGLILLRIFLPELIYTNIAGIVMYVLTGIISRRFGAVNEHYIEEKSPDIVRE